MILTYKIKLKLKKLYIMSKINGTPSIFAFIVDLIAKKNINLEYIFGYKNKITHGEIELIRGWRDTKKLSLKNNTQKVKNTPIGTNKTYYRGKLIQPEMNINDLKKVLNPNFAPQLVQVFTKNKVDGNFNSIHDTIPNLDEIQKFRNSDQYNFLTASLLDTEQFEHKKLLKAYGWLNGIEEYQEPKYGWDPKLRDNQIPKKTTMTYAHLYFYAIIKNYINFKKNMDIIEIGGGYGGLARILQIKEPNSFRKYKIIDLPFVGKLQEEFLKNTCDQITKFEFIDANKKIDSETTESTQLVIATHSLTELSPELIRGYLEKVVKKSQYVLLSMQLNFHINGANTSWVLHELMKSYTMLHFDVTEGTNVVTTLLIKN